MGYAKALDAAIGVFGHQTMAALSEPGGRDAAKVALEASLDELYHGEIVGVYFHQFVMKSPSTAHVGPRPPDWACRISTSSSPPFSYDFSLPHTFNSIHFLCLQHVAQVFTRLFSTYRTASVCE